LESIVIFSEGYSSESPSGDSSLESMTLRALDDFPLDGGAIDFVFFVQFAHLDLFHEP